MSKYLLGFMGVALLIGVGKMWLMDREIHGLTLENQALTIEKDAALASVAALEEKTALQAASLERAQEKVAQIEAERVSAVKEVQYTRRVFGDHDLENLMRRKPGLVTKRMQDATAAVFSDLSAVTE